MQKIYYNKTNNLEIIDLSGEKTIAQIKKEFGNVDYETLEIDETKEGYRIKDNKLKIYGLIEEKQQKEVEKETERQKLENKLKTKLNFTDEQIQVFKEAIGRGLFG